MGLVIFCFIKLLADSKTKVPKLLILAGISTLDVELTIGQMQGELHGPH